MTAIWSAISPSSGSASSSEAATRPRSRAPLDAVAERAHFHIPEVPASSKVPGGGTIHTVVGKTVTRHLTDLCAQLDDFARSVHRALVAIVDALDDPAPPEVQSRLDDVADQLASLQRELNGLRESE